MQDNSPNQESGSAFPLDPRCSSSDEYPSTSHSEGTVSPFRLSPSHRSESYPGIGGDVLRPSPFALTHSESARPLRRSLPSGATNQESCYDPERHSPVHPRFESGTKKSGIRHVSTLNITPMPPYLHEAEAASSPSRHASPPLSSPSTGRHTTSVNLELRSPASEQPPIEITTVPAGVPYEGSSPPSSEFNSHVHISFSPMGTSVTAMRTAPRRLHSPSAQQEQTPFQQMSGSSYYGGITLYNDIAGATRTSGDFVTMQNNLVRGLGKTQHSSRRPDRGRGYGIHQPRDDGYAEAYLNYQKQKYELLLQEVRAKMDELSRTRLEVSRLEERVIQESASSTFPVEEIQKLREEIRQLRIDCFILTMEVDLSAKGQVPLGVTDEDFYKNIFTGPEFTTNPQFNQSRRGSGTSGSQQGPASTSGSSLAMSEADENDEDNRWKCKHCTFLNHPALDKCEVCDLPRVIEDKSSSRNSHPTGSGGSDRSSEDGNVVGRVQISVRQNIGPSSQDFNRVRLRLTHKGDCSNEFTYSQRYYH